MKIIKLSQENKETHPETTAPIRSQGITETVEERDILPTTPSTPSKKVTPEFWKSLNKWVLVDVDANKLNTKPLGEPEKFGMGIEIFSFRDEMDAIEFAHRRNWYVVKK